MYVFQRYYGNFMYGFEKADEKIAKLTEPQRVRYCEDLTDWIGTPAYEIESKGAIEKYYEELATKAVGDDILTAYRLLLLYLKSNDIRLRSKVEEHRQQQIMNRTSKDLK